MIDTLFNMLCLLALSAVAVVVAGAIGASFFLACMIKRTASKDLRKK